MKQYWYVILFIGVLLVGGAVWYVGRLATIPAARVYTLPAEATVRVGPAAAETVEIFPTTTALEATRGAVEVGVVGVEGATRVVEIDGVVAKEEVGEFWQLLVNGVARRGEVATYVVAPGDTLEWVIVSR